MATAKRLFKMTDSLGNQIGNTEISYAPLVELASKIVDDSDLVIWEMSEGVLLVVGVVTKSKNKDDKIRQWLRD